MKDGEFLKKLLLAFGERKLAVKIIPQMGEKPWLVDIDVPTTDGDKIMYFQEPVLERALERALDEYDRRDAARKVLSG